MSVQHPLALQPRPGHAFATLGGGCFWCLEAVYEGMEGVVDVESGYAGGSLPHPTYRDVCEGRTGHAEVVRLEFDPAVTSFREILEVFFAIHDPTTPDRQGNDVGTQYRSVIFFHDPGQERVAREVIADAQTHHAAPVVTQLLPVPAYYRAEDYHQEYFHHHPEQGYCSFVVGPKVEKFRKTFAAKLKR